MLGELHGDVGKNRGTGGGAASATVNNSNQTPHNGSAGTSYSGGTGGASGSSGTAGKENGGSGGSGATGGAGGGGGAGNPKGNSTIGSFSGVGAQDGTGGLLVLISSSLVRKWRS